MTTSEKRKMKNFYVTQSKTLSISKLETGWDETKDYCVMTHDELTLPKAPEFKVNIIMTYK